MAVSVHCSRAASVPVSGHYTLTLIFDLLVEVLDAVDVVGGVHGERDAVQAAVAHHAGEAVGVVGFPRGPQDALHDGLTADGAALQGVLQTPNTQTHMVTQQTRPSAVSYGPLSPRLLPDFNQRDKLRKDSVHIYFFSSFLALPTLQPCDK